MRKYLQYKWIESKVYLQYIIIYYVSEHFIIIKYLDGWINEGFRLGQLFNFHKHY